MIVAVVVIVVAFVAGVIAVFLERGDWPES